MRTLTIVLLSLGTVTGFTLGAVRLAHGPHFGPAGHRHWSEHRAEFEQHVAEVCAQAAHEVFASERKGPGVVQGP